MTKLSKDLQRAIKRRQDMIRVIMDPGYRNNIDGTEFPIIAVPMVQLDNGKVLNQIIILN